MRILLIIVQTVAFLFLTASVLLSMFVLAHSCDGVGNGQDIFFRAVVFVFGNWLADIFIFAVLATANVLIVLGPIMKVEEPVKRTLLHLGVIAVQAMIILSVAALSLAAWFSAIFRDI